LGAGLVVVVSILVLALILGGRIHPRPHPGQPKPVKGKGSAGRSIGIQHPITIREKPSESGKTAMGINSNQVSALPARWWQRVRWLRHKEEPVHARAYLVPLVGFDEPTLPGPLQITTDEVTLGSDFHQAELVINDASIDRVHARILYDGKTHLITDAGTVAGTWVNYVEVAPDGTALVHMDIIHLGRIGFRFQLSEPGPLRKIIVIPLETSQ
jgi:hypothetical protein